MTTDTISRGIDDNGVAFEITIQGTRIYEHEIKDPDRLRRLLEWKKNWIKTR